MRRAYRGKFIIDDSGTVVGINLGGDHCAEHESGIKFLETAFGLDPTKMGVEKFVCNTPPEPFTISGSINRKKSLLVAVHATLPQKFANMASNGYNARTIAAYCRITPYDESVPFTAAWDDHSFGVLAQGKENIHALESILQAWKEKDLCLLLDGPKTPFDTSGLCLIRTSAFSKEVRESILQKDLNHQKLLKEAAKTKIEKDLKKAGLGYYCLTPQWTNFFNPPYQSKYPVVFFLNPNHQDKYQSGWFTVEELKLWIKGKGPIIKGE